MLQPAFHRPPMVCPDALSGHLFAMDSKELSSISDCFGDQKAIKTPKLNTIWLELIARVLNMPIELKGNNYYSKVFKRANYKLQNSMFWVVINKLWNNTFWVVITLLSLSSSLTPPFQSSLSLATPLLSVQQKSLSQPPPWQGGHVLATHLSSLLPLETVPHSQIKCPGHSHVAKEGSTIC